MSVDENADRLSTAVNTSTPTSLIFSDNPDIVSLESVRDSNLRARDLDNLVAVFGMSIIFSGVWQSFARVLC